MALVVSKVISFILIFTIKTQLIVCYVVIAVFILGKRHINLKLCMMLPKEAEESRLGLVRGDLCL